MMNKNKKLVLCLLLAVVVIAVIPFFLVPGSQFGGSDDAGSQMVEQISGGYRPWFTPVLEQAIGGELPSEIESLLFCVQTGIGVGILGYCFGYLAARKKYAGGEKQP